MAGQGQHSTERQRNKSSASECKFQGKCEGSIHSTDRDGMGGPIHGEDDNQMEEHHREPETMDNKIYEPHD